MEKEIESELAKIKELDYKNVKVIKMSAYYSIFLQVKVTENMSIKKYLALEKELKSLLKSTNRLIRFIDIEPIESYFLIVNIKEVLI